MMRGWPVHSGKTTAGQDSKFVHGPPRDNRVNLYGTWALAGVAYQLYLTPASSP